MYLILKPDSNMVILIPIRGIRIYFNFIYAILVLKNTKFKLSILIHSKI